MSTNNENQAAVSIPKGKFICGLVILILSFLTPLLIPFVLHLEISASLKAIISSLLLFGIPEVGMLLAVIILGSEGYAFIKSRILFWLNNAITPQARSRMCYRVGITLFSLSLILGFLLPYLSYYFPPPLQKNLYLYFLPLDLLFFISLFILGDKFWGKLKSLFTYD